MSHRALLGWVVAAAVACWGLGHASSAFAARVLVLAPSGHVTAGYEPIPAWATQTPVPVIAHAAARPSLRASVTHHLANLRRRGAITAAAYRRYLASIRAALRAESRLGGTGGRELGAVIGNLRQMTAAGALTPKRLPALFLTLNRNRQWWTSAPAPPSGQIVSFAGSAIDWEYYPGQGLEIQVLGSFGKASWWFSHGTQYNPQGEALLAELTPLASRRAGGLTWEYYFNFDGGAPPWTSAMSQGTALQALAHAYGQTRNGGYLLEARHSLPVFTQSPSRGVTVPTGYGLRFVQYTFDPARSDEVINAFLQTLIGLHAFAAAAGNPEAWRLFNEGDAEARREVSSFDTGTWSYYQPGVLDSISYHQLVTGFLGQLCSITKAHPYCTTAAHFRAYLQHPPPGV